MSLNFTTDLEQSFLKVSKAIFLELNKNELATLSLEGEHSQFIRFNNSKVRQCGVVTDTQLEMQLFINSKTASYSFQFSGNFNTDSLNALSVLNTLRTEIPQLPADPNIVIPTLSDTSHSASVGKLLDFENAAKNLLDPLGEIDFTGLYAAGPTVRAVANSLGQYHWFSVESFFVDFSLWHSSGKAVKAGYAGTHWNQKAYENEIALSKSSLAHLNLPPVELPSGDYRAYLAPAAVAEILGMFSWKCLSESAIQQKESALLQMREGRAHFSPLFSLSENFTTGLAPRFSPSGDLAPEKIQLIEKGNLKNTLVHARTAKEYGITGNGANAEEGLRSPEIAPGKLQQADVFAQLGTGVYLSNLHYLNWSEVLTGRVTGMTRYSCFYVENGEVKGPIKDMRFDDTIFSIFGKNLESVTDFRNIIPNISTYERRQLGGEVVPGMMLTNFKFTL